MGRSPTQVSGIPNWRLEIVGFAFQILMIPLKPQEEEINFFTVGRNPQGSRQQGESRRLSAILPPNIIVFSSTPFLLTCHLLTSGQLPLVMGLMQPFKGTFSIRSFLSYTNELSCPFCERQSCSLFSSWCCLLCMFMCIGVHVIMCVQVCICVCMHVMDCVCVGQRSTLDVTPWVLSTHTSFFL